MDDDVDVVAPTDGGDTEPSVDAIGHVFGAVIPGRPVLTNFWYVLSPVQLGLLFIFTVYACAFSCLFPGKFRPPSMSQKYLTLLTYLKSQYLCYLDVNYLCI